MKSVKQILKSALNEIKEKHGITIQGVESGYIGRGGTNEETKGDWRIRVIASLDGSVRDGEYYE